MLREAQGVLYVNVQEWLDLSLYLNTNLKKYFPVHDGYEWSDALLQGLQDGNGEYSYMLLLKTPVLNAGTTPACKSYVCSFLTWAI